MGRTLGILLILLAAGGGGYAVLVGGSFSAVYLMGYLGTGGNEAGRELAWMAGATVVAALVSWGLFKLGQRLLRPA